MFYRKGNEDVTRIYLTHMRVGKHLYCTGVTHNCTLEYCSLNQTQLVTYFLSYIV